MGNQYREVSTRNRIAGEENLVCSLFQLGGGKHCQDDCTFSWFCLKEKRKKVGKHGSKVTQEHHEAQGYLQTQKYRLAYQV